MTTTDLPAPSPSSPDHVLVYYVRRQVDAMMRSSDDPELEKYFDSDHATKRAQALGGSVYVIMAEERIADQHEAHQPKKSRLQYEVGGGGGGGSAGAWSPPSKL